MIFFDYCPAPQSILPKDILLDLCVKYWSRTSDDSKFLFTVAELEREFELPKGRVSSLVRKSTTAYVVLNPCCDCGAPRKRLITSRECNLDKDEWILIDKKWGIATRCEDCMQKLRDIQNKIQFENAMCLLRTEAREAYKKEIYLSLKPIELQVLIQLAVTNMDCEKAFKKVGISVSRGSEIMEVCRVKNLIVCTGKEFLFPETAKDILIQLKQETRLKPVLNPMEKEIFRRLKIKYAIVLPHQLIRTFISEDLAKDAINQFSNKVSFGTYLCMEVDFLICDEEFRPIRAIEYQGGYHQSSDQIPKDKFKKFICDLAGVPLIAYDRTSLWKDEELKEHHD